MYVPKWDTLEVFRIPFQYFLPTIPSKFPCYYYYGSITVKYSVPSAMFWDYKKAISAVICQPNSISIMS